MNVLLTCAGRRTSLLLAFQDAVRAYGGRVFGSDCEALAPALYQADKAFHLPRLTDASYLDLLLDVAHTHQVSLVVPTIDPELPVLATAVDKFAKIGCTLLISTPTFVNLAADKWATLQTYSAEGVATVPSWLPDPETEGASWLPENLIVKPRSGSASQHVYRIPQNRLPHALALVNDPIIQAAIDAPELTIDILLDFDGNPVHYVPRLRLQTRAGESVQGLTIADDGLQPWLDHVLELSARLGARGPLTVQAFLTGDGPILSEINARFGGGFPLAHAAGGHYPHWIMQLLRGEEMPTRLGIYTTGLYMTRYDTELFIDRPLWA